MYEFLTGKGENVVLTFSTSVVLYTYDRETLLRR